MSLNWGIIGAGVIAQEMAQALTNLYGQVYAIASRTRERAEALAGQYPIHHVYSSAQELLNDPSVDLVYVATPHNLHYDIMRQALLAL